MIILPAIDLFEGQVVRLRQGKLEQKTVYPGDPFFYATRWEEEGANCLHVVDLEAAFTGEQRNLSLIKKLIGSLNIPVEVGGGIRSFKAAEALLEAGASRVVIGTKAVEDPKFLRGLVAGFGGQAIAVGVDAREGKVAVKGWAEVTHVDALEFIDQICEIGVGTIIFTDIATDGMLSGPSFSALEGVLQKAKCQVIASGGVASMEDVRRLASLPGLYGTIIGKALFDGTIDLSEAVAVANAASDARGAV